MLLHETERFLRCHLAADFFLAQGLVESVSPQLLVASSLNQPNKGGVLFIHCFNPTDGLLQLLAGLTVGQYTMLDGIDVQAETT